MSNTTPATILRERLESSEILVTAGTYDALSVRLAEQAGFDAGFTSGFGFSATKLGKPDVGLLTMPENVNQLRSMARSTSMPLIADVDTGYGNALNVRRTIREVLDTDAAGVILEDQQWPKRCGHMDDKDVVSADDHVERIRAAADVRAEYDQDLVIVGRTDARAPLGLEEALRRGHLYADAGADIIFIEAPQSENELQMVADEFEVPTLANMIEGGKTPYLTWNKLDDMGFDIAVYALSGLFAAAEALDSVFTEIQKTGSVSDTPTYEFDQFDDAIAGDHYRTLAEKYSSGDQKDNK